MCEKSDPCTLFGGDSNFSPVATPPPQGGGRVTRHFFCWLCGSHLDHSTQGISTGFCFSKTKTPEREFTSPPASQGWSSVPATSSGRAWRTTTCAAPRNGQPGHRGRTEKNLDVPVEVRFNLLPMGKADRWLCENLPQLGKIAAVWA